MAGAHAVQIVSALLRARARAPAVLREGLERWMEEHEYESLAQLRGSMSLARCPDPRAFERGDYMRVLQTWRRDDAPDARAASIMTLTGSRLRSPD